jgi:small subunit ribosomal protein S6
MKKYEFALVLTEEAGKDEAAAKKLAQEILSKVKAKVEETKYLGIRELAYPIKKRAKGAYAFLAVEMDEAAVKELDKILKLEDRVIRYLLVRAE